MSRSLKVGQEYLKKVKYALVRNSFPSQKALALDLGLALSTVSRFCTGKPVDYGTFVDICDILGLEWRELADLSHALSVAAKTSSSTISPKSSLFSKQVNPSNVDLVNKRSTLSTSVTVPFPEGVVPPDSPFYQTRDDIESTCCQTVIQASSLIRIKAPKLMGKTSLIIRTLAYAQSQNYQTVYLNLGNVEKIILTDLDKFLRWLCLMVGKQLKVKNQLSNYWNTDILSSNDNCTTYFAEYLLPKINSPLVLAFDEVDHILPHVNVREDFLEMLRSWHEKGKISPIWRNLRLILAHSTAGCISFDFKQSLFKKEVLLELPELNAQQIQKLATLHQLDWTKTKIIKLMHILGGHPYLVRLAMYYVSCDRFKLKFILANASKESGIYSNHLRQHLETIRQKPSLAASLKKVVNASEAVVLEQQLMYQLHSMGLVQLKDNQVIPQCNLYREYFRRVLVE